MVIPLQKRRLGRTNLWTSIIGFGGTWISELNMDEARKVIKRAYELGINYFDTAKLDGDSEEKLGIALEGVRDKVIIATKTGSRTGKEAFKDIKCSLHRLKTERLDIIQLHGIDDEKTLKKAMGPEGSLEACKRAKAMGLVDYIGITGHKPYILLKAIETNEFDTVLVPINIVTRQALEELVPFAKSMDVGVAAMKPFFAKTSNLITCLYKPSLHLISDEPELKNILGKDKFSMVQTALRFVLAQDVSVVVTGFRSVGEVEMAVNVGEEFKGLTKSEEEKFRVQFDEYYCRDCGLCLPCPNNLNVPAILKFYMLSSNYGLKKWAEKLYKGLEVGIDNCNECGECELKCPYKLPIVSMLKKTKKIWSLSDQEN
ncbi:MAG: aldo/keto reductase [Candidatus Bathyarchaeota archaeon]|nr:aldo/keto reductase [Candidatus Bathyarchaeota archaeon]